MLLFPTLDIQVCKSTTDQASTIRRLICGVIHTKFNILTKKREYKDDTLTFWAICVTRKDKFY